MQLHSILGGFYFEVFTVRVIYFIVCSALTNGDMLSVESSVLFAF